MVTVDERRLFRLIMGAMGSTAAQTYLSTIGEGQMADEQSRERKGRVKTIKEMLRIPEQHYTGEYCTCGALLWWDGTCSDCDDERLRLHGG